MFRQLVYGLLTALALTACSSTNKEAPVEDLTATAPHGTAPISEAARGTQTSTSAAETGAPVVEAQEKPKPKSAGEPGAETRALPMSGAEVSQLGGGTTETQGTQGGAGTAGESGTGIGPMGYGPTGAPGMEALKDPNSPLAKRLIYFVYDSSDIPDEFQSLLEAHADFLKAHKDVKVVVQGNTDERGSREYNLALGQRRAESVLQALNLLGVPENQMEAVSFGEEKPVALGHDEASWKLNRRAEIVYPNE
jgi:peptidoglycan-associated lipoprotein